MGKLERKQKV